MAISKSHPMRQRRIAWRQLMRRRTKAVRLVEEMNLRIGRLQPLTDKLKEISARMVCVRNALRDGENNTLGRVDELRAELRQFMRITLESASTLDRRIQRTADLQYQLRRRQARPLGGQPAARCLDRQEVPQSRPQLPRPDPGGQHRPDACGR